MKKLCILIATCVLAVLLLPACASKKAVTVTFYDNYDGGETVAVQAKIGDYLPSRMPSREDARFYGWYFEPETVNRVESTYKLKGDLSVYACWTDNAGKFTVTYDLNGGVGTAPSEKVTAGESMTIPTVAISKSGYEFAGWILGESTYVAGQTFVPTRDSVLKAKWVKITTISFSLDGGTGPLPETKTMREGETMTMPQDSGYHKTDYIFKGWAVTAVDGREVPKTNYMSGEIFVVPDYDVKIIAIWTRPGTDIA